MFSTKKHNRFVGMDFLYHMFDGMDWAQHHVSRLGIPLLMMLSGDDHVVDNRSSRKLFAGLTDTDKQLYICRGFYHEIFNEVDRADPIGVFKTFLKRLEK